MTSKLPKITLYDTTLRDGNQAKGLNFSLEDKLTLARMLDDFGIHYVEGGWPNATNPLDVAFFERAAKMTWKRARICAFGSTRRPGKKAGKDPMLAELVRAGTPVITIFGKSWDLHVTEVLRTGLDENLEMIRDSVAHLKKYAGEVIYDAEHFFDGYLANPEYALRTLKAARDGGADLLVLCDTNGGMALPWEVERITTTVRKRLKAPLGIHAHNDSGTAVANALAAVRGGATQVQGTVNGYGERCGNANLTVIVPNLQLKMGLELVTPAQLRGLRALSVGVSEVANLADDIRQPYVGEAAFSHKGGAHIDGVMKVARSFEHVEPGLVGNSRDFIVSNQSGTSLVVDKIRRILPGADKKDPKVADILGAIKEKEEAGYHFEVAGGSFELLARRKLGLLRDAFQVRSYRVIEEHRESGGLYSEATVKLRVGGKTVHMAAEGNGPVDAMAGALRKCLDPFFPELRAVRLQDYKVRVLDSDKGTGAVVRVWIRFHDSSPGSEDSWGTIGVSSNVIEASWTALMDGINYQLLVRAGGGEPLPERPAGRPRPAAARRPKR